MEQKGRLGPGWASGSSKGFKMHVTVFSERWGMKHTGVGLRRPLPALCLHGLLLSGPCAYRHSVVSSCKEGSSCLTNTALLQMLALRIFPPRLLQRSPSCVCVSMHVCLCACLPVCVIWLSPVELSTSVCTLCVSAFIISYCRGKPS